MLGSWIQIPDPAVAEIMAELGYDWVAVDAEHTDTGLDTLSNIFRGMKNTGTAPLVRVASNDMMDIRRSLDIGAEGVIVPLINTAEEARLAVSYAKYPPDGVRGFAFCRTNGWGARFDEYAKNANETVSVIAMVESRQAVENINEILDVDGIDGVFIGPYDMSGSFGILGQLQHPILEKSCDKVLATCKKHGKAAGLHIVKPDPAAIRANIDKGFTFIALGIDAWCLQIGLQGYITQARQAAQLR